MVLHFFVHGDGRLPVSRSDDIGSDFRIQGVAEVDVLQSPGETVGTLARNQMSKSELRALGKVVHTETNRGPLTSTITADRLNPNSVAVKMVVSGSVPWNVAGPQPAIDFEYNVTLTYDPATSRVKWTASASHDGFPGHEMFIECNGVVRFNKIYLPTFFSPVSTGTAKPSILQSIDGARALGGATHAQTWSLMADFAP